MDLATVIGILAGTIVVVLAIFVGGDFTTFMAPAGPPDWLVTFADLMSILVCFFVLIISFSVEDEKKLQIVAGSMREAFGVRIDSMKSGVIEIHGAPQRDYVRHVTPVPEKEDSDFANERDEQDVKQGPDAHTHDTEQAETETPRQFATAAESLRQALARDARDHGDLGPDHPRGAARRPEHPARRS